MESLSLELEYNIIYLIFTCIIAMKTNVIMNILGKDSRQMPVKDTFKMSNNLLVSETSLNKIKPNKKLFKMK